QDCNLSDRGGFSHHILRSFRPPILTSSVGVGGLFSHGHPNAPEYMRFVKLAAVENDHPELWGRGTALTGTRDSGNTSYSRADSHHSGKR
ncbi:MAG: hypothetical protein ACRD5K_08930, partial [Candidatus Acidiferrales bacterium]